MRKIRKTSTYNFRCTPEFKRLLVFVADNYFDGSLTKAIETSIRKYAEPNADQEKWSTGKYSLILNNHTGLIHFANED